MTMGTDAPLGEVTVTQQLLAVAPSRGEHRALVGGPADPACGYADLAATVRAAAAGLAWRGLQPRDVVGVYVPDATCYVLAAVALAAADRSWVRQVISFGEAPDAIQFAALLGMGTLAAAGGRASDAA